MKYLFLLSLGIQALASCRPDELVDVIVPSATCGSDGARMQATVDGNDWCANASVMGVGDNSTAMITGINSLGGTMILQLDSLATGPQAITEAANALMYMNLSLPYVPIDSDPGVLTIASLDTVAHKVKGSFTVTLHADGGGSKAVNGSFDVHYTVQ